ncbi:MAG: hypothetical protein HYX92_20770 [Chloroflexi bacterium]|nr:hypothetical protein [Chloroflexota bacterium]
MGEPTYEVVWPLGKSVYETVPLASRASSLEGKTICELWDWRFRGEEVFPLLRELLSRRYPGVKFVEYGVFGDTHGPKEREVIARLPQMLREQGCDAVLSGIGS